MTLNLNIVIRFFYQIKIWAIYFFVLLLSDFALAQHNYQVYDSGEKERLENKLKTALESYDFNLSIKIIDSMELYALKAKDTAFLGYAYEAKAQMYRFKNKIKLSTQYSVKAANVALKLKDYQKYIATTSMISGNYLIEGQTDSAFFYAELIKPYLTDTTRISVKHIYYNLKSELHENTARMDSAIFYALKNIETKDELNISHIPGSYRKLGDLFHSVKDYEKSLHYLNKGIASTKTHKEELKVTRYRLLMSKCNSLYKLGRLSECKLLLKDAIALAELVKSENYVVKAKLFLSKVNFDLVEKKTEQLVLSDTLIEGKKIRKATLFGFYFTKFNQYVGLNNFNKAKEIALKLETLFPSVSSLNTQLSYYEAMRQFWESQGDYKKSLEAQTKYLNINEKINKRVKLYNTYELENKYQLSKKEAEIANQKIALEKEETQKRFYGLAALGLLLVVFGSWFVFRQHQKRKAQEILAIKRENDIKKLESLIEGEEKERLRVARELHDGINGDLSAIKHKLNAAKNNLDSINEAIDMIDKSCSQVRAISHNLVPPMLEKFDLKTIIMEYCVNMNEAHSPKITSDYLGDNLRLPKHIEINIFRIVQELVTNSVKHAMASEIHVQLTTRDNYLQLSVEDNGIGFNVNESDAKGIGISNIKSRVAFLQGELDIKSNNKGTSVSVLLEDITAI